MLNLIKMDLYHAFKSKCFYTTLLIAVLCFVASIVTLKFDTSSVEQMAQEAMQQAEQDDSMINNIGIQMGTLGSMNSDTVTVDMALALLFGGGTILIMGAIFCVIFVTNDHSSGFIKNVISKKNYRIQTSISKAITMVVYTFIEIVACFGSLLLSLLICFQKIKVESWSTILGYLGTQFLLQLAILSLCVLVCNLIRNMAFGMAFAICLSVGLFTIIPQLIDHLKLPFKISDYLLSILVKSLPMQYDGTIYLRAILVSLIGIAVYIFGSTLVMKRQDIK